MSSISQKLIELNEVKQDIKTAITNKGISVDDDFKTYPSKILEIPTDRSGLYNHDEWLNDVNFYDIDGSILYSYTLDEAKALPRLPLGPEHEGLVFQEWNWTLNDIKSLPSNGMADIGPNYNTVDGATKIFINISSDYYGDNISNINSFSLQFKQSVANAVTIDWGDGTTSSSSTANSVVTVSHTYTSFGKYTVSVSRSSGTLILGGGSSYYFVKSGARFVDKMYLGSSVTSCDGYALAYGTCDILTVHKNLTLVNQSFRNLYRVQQITIPRSATNPANYVFYQDYTLRVVCIPKTITNIGTQSFYSCKGLMRLCIPDTCTTLDNLFGTSDTYPNLMLKALRWSGSVTTINCYLGSCRTLQRLVIPYGVTTFSPNITNCYNLKTIELPESVTTFNPTVGSTVYVNYWIIRSLTLPTASAAIPTSNLVRIFITEDANETLSTAEYWKDLASSYYKLLND